MNIEERIAVTTRAKVKAKQHDVIGACRTLRDGLGIPLNEAVAQVEKWLRMWGRIKS